MKMFAQGPCYLVGLLQQKKGRFATFVTAFELYTGAGHFCYLVLYCNCTALDMDLLKAKSENTQNLDLKCFLLQPQ